MPNARNPSSIGAILLAAGMSRRMGSPKALLDLDGKPLIARLVETVSRVNEIGRIIVVTGHQPDQIRRALDYPRVSFFHNDIYEAGGMLSSIKAGVRALDAHSRAFFVMLLDQPLVKAETVSTLARAWIANPSPIVVPVTDGQRGHPILIDAHFSADILALPDTGSLKDFVTKHAHERQLVPTDDAGILTSLDIPGDYQMILKMLESPFSPP